MLGQIRRLSHHCCLLLLPHMLLCREHLLQLPRNSQAFALLQDQGMHPAFKDLPQRLQLPGSSRSSLGVRLQASLSQLAHWCPLFGE